MAVCVHSITWITEAGLYDHWMDSLSSNSTVCQRAPSKITVRTPLSLGNVWVRTAESIFEASNSSVQLLEYHYHFG